MPREGNDAAAAPLGLAHLQPHLEVFDGHREGRLSQAADRAGRCKLDKATVLSKYAACRLLRGAKHTHEEAGSEQRRRCAAPQREDAALLHERACRGDGATAPRHCLELHSHDIDGLRDQDGQAAAARTAEQVACVHQKIVAVTELQR